MTAVRSALVVGGGIAGLVCARALAMRGIAVTLFERKARIEDEGGIGIGIQSNAMDALHEIGLARDCVAAGVPVDTLFVHAPGGELLAARPADRHAGSPWPGFTGISRAALHSILVDGARNAGVVLCTGAEVRDVCQHADGVEATLADGSSFSSDLLVGADGIYSRLRDQLFPDYGAASPTGEAVWRGLVEGVRKNEVRFVFGGGVGTVGYTPLADDTYLYIVDRADRAPPREATDLARRMTELLAPYGGFVPELLARLSFREGDVTYRRLETVTLPRPWYLGRILLIGDAAHAGPPTLAQGAAMGIEDGIVLAQCLSARQEIADALGAFMNRRWQRVTTIVNASLVISRAQMRPDGQAAISEASKAAAAALARPY